jgi:hypothetical protein
MNEFVPKLPPLPEPDTHCWDDDTQRDVWSHSADQMRAYGAACAAAEREACAAEFDRRDAGVGGWYEADEPAQIIRARGET